MVDNTLDILRQDALSRRVKGLHGGHRIHWSAKDIALIRDYVKEIPEKVIRAAPTAVRKFVDLDSANRKFANAGIAVKNMQPGDLNFLFTISSEQVDLAGDVISIAGVDCSNYNKNPVVLNAHDSSELPIATSSAPWASGAALMATAKFLALGALTLEGHAQKTLVAALECDFPLVSNGALELAASTLQYYIDTATGWRVNEDSFSFDGPANIIVGGKDRVVSLSITISRHSGKATKTLSSEGKSLTVSGECKKMESSGPKF